MCSECCCLKRIKMVCNQLFDFCINSLFGTCQCHQWTVPCVNTVNPLHFAELLPSSCVIVTHEKRLISWAAYCVANPFPMQSHAYILKQTEAVQNFNGGKHIMDIHHFRIVPIRQNGYWIFIDYELMQFFSASIEETDERTAFFHLTLNTASLFRFWWHTHTHNV